MAAAVASGHTATATRVRRPMPCPRAPARPSPSGTKRASAWHPPKSAALPLRGIVRLLFRECVVVALPIFGAFVLGLGARRWLQRYFAVLFRAQFALGMGLLAALSGWSFDVTLRN